MHEPRAVPQWQRCPDGTIKVGPDAPPAEHDLWVDGQPRLLTNVEYSYIARVAIGGDGDQRPANPTQKPPCLFARRRPRFTPSSRKKRVNTMSTADATPQEQAAQAAAAAAAKEFNSEVFALLALGILITALRTYSRISSVGFKNLQLDDLLVWLAAVTHASEKDPEGRQRV